MTDLRATVARALCPPAEDPERPHGVSGAPLWTYYIEQAERAIAVIPEPMPSEVDEVHCPSCICGRRAPVQAAGRHMPCGPKPSGTVTWEEHLKAYEEYASRYGRSQSAERLAERAGFGYWEITDLLGHEPETWTPRGGQ